MMIAGIALFCLGCFIASQNTQSMIAWPLIVFGLVLVIVPARGRDLGQWENSDPAQQETREWFKGLMQPDAPSASCCGEADAYWCDDIHVKDGKTFCKITDDRPDEPRGRPHRPVGEQHEIPENKLKWDRGNPTGHAVIFLGQPGYDFVFCFVQPGGA